jgi:hypothetical protein
MAHQSKQLNQAWRLLNSSYRSTAEAWKDGTQRDFEQQIWQRFEHEMPQLIKDVEALETILEEIRKICRQVDSQQKHRR